MKLPLLYEYRDVDSKFPVIVVAQTKFISSILKSGLTLD